MDIFLISKNGEICREASEDLVLCEEVPEEISSILPPLCPVNATRATSGKSRNSSVVPLPTPKSHNKQLASLSSNSDLTTDVENITRNNSNKQNEDNTNTETVKSILPKQIKPVSHSRRRVSSGSKTDKAINNGIPRDKVIQDQAKCRKPRRRSKALRNSITQDPERFKAGLYRQIVGRRHALDMGRGVKRSSTAGPEKNIHVVGDNTQKLRDDASDTPSEGRSAKTTFNSEARIYQTFSDDQSRQWTVNPGLNATMELTIKQIKAFREVFDLFDQNGGGTIDALELDATLRSVNICLKPGEIEEVLGLIDKDGKGEIDFNEFLQLMTNTKRFIASLVVSPNDVSTNREALLFEALTAIMKTSALHSMDEIVGYYNNKYRKVKTPHVVNHYADGARLIGLNEKQLKEHMEKLKETNRSTNSLKSPYAQPLQIVMSNSTNIGRMQPNNVPVAKTHTPGLIRLKSIHSSLYRNTSPRSSPVSINQGKGHSNKVNKKERGWMNQRTEHINVQLPPVHFKDLEPFDELTAEDLPNIRTRVISARKEFSAGRRKDQFENNIRHWRSLATSQIRPLMLRGYFREVFSVYASVNQSILAG